MNDATKKVWNTENQEFAYYQKNRALNNRTWNSVLRSKHTENFEA